MKTPTPKILIKGEGRDEWQNRYFKFAVRGSESDIPPFSAQEILDNPNNLFVALINAAQVLSTDQHVQSFLFGSASERRPLPSLG